MSLIKSWLRARLGISSPSDAFWHAGQEFVREMETVLASSRGPFESLVALLTQSAPIDVPHWVIGHTDVFGTESDICIHFLDPATTGRQEQRVYDVLKRLTADDISIVVTKREPLCTVHTDCWEAGEGMRRECYESMRLEYVKLEGGVRVEPSDRGEP